MRKFYKRVKDFVICLPYLVMSFPVLADLPTPPSNELPSGQTGMDDVAYSMVSKDLKYLCVIVGVILFLAGGVTIFSAFRASHDKQDLTHFFKYGFVGVVATALGFGMVYYSQSILTSQT